MNDHPKYQRSMDGALDHTLSEEELHALKARIDASPEEAGHWDRLTQVDSLFRTTPKVAPSPGFAERVMAAIAAMHLPDYVNHRFGIGIALGLSTAALLALPVLSALALLFLSVLTDPGALNVILQAMADGAGFIIGLADNTGTGIQTLVTHTPIVPALLSTTIPVTMLWIWVIWYLVGGRRVAARLTA